MKIKFSNYFASLIFLITLILSDVSLAIAIASQKIIESDKEQLTIDYLKKLPDNDYILGPGDNLKIIVSREYPELTTDVIIDGEGTIFLQKLNRIYVEDLSINELNKLLNTAYKKYVKYPDLQILINGYRTIRVLVEGEVENPGLQTLEGSFSLRPKVKNKSKDINYSEDILISSQFSNAKEDNIFYFPTVFDALRESGGVTLFSDLSNIQIIRKNVYSEGGGKKTTKINFEELLNKAENSQNIRIYDQDIIRVSKTEKPNKLILRKAILSNLNPKFISVFISGRVNIPGRTIISKASTLNDALDMAGGAKALKGKVTFIRFNNNGTVDRRVFSYKKSHKRYSYENPLLSNGDLIVVGDNIINKANEIVTDFTSPLVGIFSTYGLIKAISD